MEHRELHLRQALQWRIEKRELLSKLVCATCARDPLSHDARVFGVDPEGDIVFSNCFALPHDTTAEYITDHMVCLFERSLRMFPVGPFFFMFFYVVTSRRMHHALIFRIIFEWSMGILDDRTSARTARHKPVHVHPRHRQGGHDGGGRGWLTCTASVPRYATWTRGPA